MGQPRPGCVAELLLTVSELSFLGAYARQFRRPGPDRLGPPVLEFRLFRAIWFTFFLTDGRSVSHTHSLANRDADVNRNP